MDQLRILRNEIRNKTLKTRSIQSIVESRRFERLWSESDKVVREDAERLVLKGRKQGIIQWMKNHPSLDLGERPLSYLRTRGKQLRIKNYSRLSKPELIRDIERKELETTIKEQDINEQKQS